MSSDEVAMLVPSDTPTITYRAFCLGRERSPELRRVLVGFELHRTDLGDGQALVYYRVRRYALAEARPALSEAA